MKYQRKATVIEAEQFLEGHPLPFRDRRAVGYNDGRWYVVTAHGQETTIIHGDWIIPEPDGRGFYPCKPDIFAATYVPVPDSRDAPPRRQQTFEEWAPTRPELWSENRTAHAYQRNAARAAWDAAKAAAGAAVAALAPPATPTGDGGWVPVGERLPEPGVDVLTWGVHGQVLVDARSETEDAWNCAYRSADVTHWMPLPAPPATAGGVGGGGTGGGEGR